MVKAASLPSSPAQAASTIGSSKIAAHFADIRTCNPFQRHDARGVLDRPPVKWNSQFSVPIVRKHTQFRPASIGEAMARAGPDVREGTRRGNVDQPRPLADHFQPRLEARPACLIVTFENWCDFSAPIRLWKR